MNTFWQQAEQSFRKILTTGLIVCSVIAIPFIVWKLLAGEVQAKAPEAQRTFENAGNALYEAQVGHCEARKVLAESLLADHYNSISKLEPTRINELTQVVTTLDCHF